MIADKYREKTAGMTEGKWVQEGIGAGIPTPVGDPHGDCDWELEQVLGVGTEEDAKGLAFLTNTHSEVADLIEAVEEARSVGRYEDDPAMDDVDDALTALREKMEELG